MTELRFASGRKASAEAYVSLARTHRSRGDLASAEAAVDQGRSVHPHHLGLAAEYAELAMSRRDWPQAAVRWRAVLDGFGDRAPADAYRSLARAYRGQGDFDAAEAAVEKGRALDPGSIRFATEYAEIATARRDWPEAAIRWQAALDGFGDKVPAEAYRALSRAHRGLGDLDSAETVVAKGRSVHSGDLGLAIEHAELATSRRDWPEAVLRWRGVLDGFGDSAPPGAYAALARAYRAQGDLDAAEAAAEKGRPLDPGSLRLATEYAEIATARRDWPEAAIRWQAVLDSFGDQAPVEAYRLLSRAHRGLGDLDSAETVVAKGRSVHSGDLGLALEHAELAMSRKDWPEAALRWQAVLDGFGDKVPAGAYRALSRAHRGQGNLDSAETAATSGRGLHPGDLGIAIEHAEIALSRRDWPEAAIRWQAVLDGFGEGVPSADAYRALARAHRGQGDLVSAEAAVAKGRAAHSDHLGLASEYAEIATARRDWPEAAIRWQAVLDSFGEKAPGSALLALSRAHRTRGAFADAEAAVQRGQRAHPSDLTLLVEYAEIAAAKKNWPEIVIRWQAVVDNFRDAAPAKAFVWLSRAHRSQANFEAAEVAVRRGRAANPGDVGLAAEYAEIAMARKDWSEVVTRSQAILDEFGDAAPTDTFASLGRALRSQGDFDAAEAAIGKGRALDPGSMRFATEYAEIASARRDWPEAAIRWQAVLDRFGNATPPGVFQSLSRALRHQGDFERAAAAMRMGRAAHPDHPGIAADLAEISKDNLIERVAARSAIRSLPLAPAAQPLVSIIVTTRNGKYLLDSMFRSFMATNSYPTIEFIVVDHASTDGSRDLLDRWSRLLPIRVLAYETNNSFSFANNRAAEIAEGALLLLLNNDIVFSQDIVGRMVAALEDGRVGAVGVKQYPGSPSSVDVRLPYHIGIRFDWNADARFLRPYNVTPEITDDLLSNQPASFPAVTGAIIMCRREEYLDIGGLNENYSYGFEDVDFCCKVRFGLDKEVVNLNDVYAFHNESTTRKTDSGQRLSAQRLNNIELLKQRFSYILKNEFKQRMLFDDGSIRGKQFTVGIAVTSTDLDSGAGDLFTALGLGRALRKQRDWNVRYLARPLWYDARDIDLYIAMRDDVDIRSVANTSPHLIRVAWMRNWFDRWIEQPWFDAFDVHLCSSAKATEYVRDRAGIACDVLPIGVALDLFNMGPSLPEYEADYVFTGSHWKPMVPREIEEFDPEALPYRYAIYGKNWEQREKPLPAHRGFASYVDLPRIYNSAKITVDDTAHHAKSWGSVNSRVFEALASGSLVLTNNAIGSEELFGGRLPVWNSVTELTQLIDFYLRNPEQRDALLRSLRDEVVAAHSYDRRADELIALLARRTRRLRIAIKCPVPHRREVAFWGDYHLARSLAGALAKFGHQVRIDLLPDWTASQSLADDVAIVLRGLSAYVPSSDQVNICWLISHPAKVPDEELERYDHVFVASSAYAEKLGARIAKPVTPLLQCSDPEIFFPAKDPELQVADLLFVGNSRRQRRKIVDDAIAQHLPIAVYGREWEGLIDSSVVHGQRIENEELHAYYGAAKIVLNDHWPDMAANGFISNRIFDVALSGGFVISDEFAGSELFGDAIVTYDTPARLRELCEEWLADDERRAAAAARLREVVLAGHTVDHRAAVLNETIAQLAAGRATPPVDEPLSGFSRSPPRLSPAEPAVNDVGLDRKRASAIARIAPDPSLVVARPPLVERHRNAIATPTSVVGEGEWRTLTGALYSDSGALIPLSQRVCGTLLDIVRLNDPATFDGRATHVVSGRGLYIGHIFNQYGHFITEGLGALWPLALGETFDYFAAHPFLFGSLPSAYVRHAFQVLGLRDSAVRIIREPTRFEDITIPERTWTYNRSVKAVFRDVVDRIALPATGEGRRLYLSRSHIRNREIANENQIEAVFSARGFTVVHPEELSFEDQLNLYAQASVLAGFAGSQLHNVLFCRPGTLVISLGDGYRSPIITNQMMCGAIRSSPTMTVPFAGHRNSFDLAALAAVFEQIA